MSHAAHAHAKAAPKALPAPPCPEAFAILDADRALAKNLDGCRALPDKLLPAACQMVLHALGLALHGVPAKAGGHNEKWRDADLLAQLRAFSPSAMAEATLLALLPVTSHADFNDAAKLRNASSALQPLAHWVQCVVRLAAAASPQLGAKAQQAEIAGRVAAKQAALAKAREGVAALEEEVRALQAERDAAAQAAAGAGGGGK